MLLKGLYLLLSLGTVGLMLVEAPMGILLTSTPEKGKVGRSTDSREGGGATVRNRSVPLFIFMGGGYRGGK